MTKGGWDGHVQKTCEKFMEGGPWTTFFTYIFNKIYYTRFHVLLKGIINQLEISILLNGQDPSSSFTSILPYINIIL